MYSSLLYRNVLNIKIKLFCLFRFDDLILAQKGQSASSVRGAPEPIHEKKETTQNLLTLSVPKK